MSVNNLLTKNSLSEKRTKEIRDDFIAIHPQFTSSVSDEMTFYTQ